MDMVFDLVKVKASRLSRWKGSKKTANLTDGSEVKSKVGQQNYYVTQQSTLISKIVIEYTLLEE
jgi:hypothetical protein